MLNDALHPPVRVASEFLLAAAREKVAKLSQPMARLGDSEQVVIDRSGDWIELDEKAFFASLDVHGSRSISKAKAIFFIDHVKDAAQIERPEAERVDLDGDNFFLHDWRIRVGYANPAEIKLQPVPEGFLCGIESRTALAKLRAVVVDSEAVRAENLFVATLCPKIKAIAEGESAGALDLLLNFSLRRPTQREHQPSV